MKVPQLIVTLSPAGKLIVELPGVMATRRKIELRTAEAGESLIRMLEAQVHDQTEIGLDGAPTERQVRHWERHGTWPDERCPFCIREKRVKVRAKRGSVLDDIMVKRDGVVVRKVSSKKMEKVRADVVKALNDLEID